MESVSRHMRPILNLPAEASHLYNRVLNIHIATSANSCFGCRSFLHVQKLAYLLWFKIFLEPLNQTSGRTEPASTDLRSCDDYGDHLP